MPKITPAPLSRPLSMVAGEIAADWGAKLTETGPDFGFGPTQNPARPYWDAMRRINTTDLGAAFYSDRADSIIRYFLANAGQWRGAKAREIKAELNAALADFDKGRGR